MNVLVTGGAGYIGSHMVRTLASRGSKAIVLDTLEFGHKSALPKEAVFVEGNISDEALITQVITENNIDAVIHFAGYLRVEESVKDPIKYMQNNVIRPIALLEAMRKTGVDKIIFSSTAAVYGTPTISPIPEDHPKEPVSPYGLSKWCFEEMLAQYDKMAQIRSISLRYFNAAGASGDGLTGEDHAVETHLIPLACQAALGKRAQMYMYGTDYPTADGTAVRDYIHLDDLCDAHLVTLDALEAGHATDRYNVGTGIGISVKEVLSVVKEVSGVDFMVTNAPRRSGDPAELVADSNKLQKEFSWQPKFSDIRSIVSSAWNWHKSHPNGYGGSGTK
ncbi:UDP-glucose 4-epimerase GalE [Candidatus Woesebacteria bacterium]|nr:UDP-glucose 4-epimerase GalE [Candidatus Woesebacteria bacterium]